MLVSLLLAAVVWLLPSAFAASPDSLIVHRYSLESGLPTNNIRQVFEDATGFIWLGTEEGLFRFDGNAFRMLGSEADDAPDLGGERVTNISGDRSGAVWISTALRVYRYTHRNNRFTTFPLHGDIRRGIPGSVVHGVGEAKDGTVIIATDVGLSTYLQSSRSIRHYPYDRDMEVTVQSVFSTAEVGNDMWLVVSGNLVRMNRLRNTVQLIPREAIDPELQRPHHFRLVVKESDSTLLIVNRVGLYRYRIDSGYATRLRQFGSECFGAVAHGRLVWVGLTSDELLSFEMGTEHFSRYDLNALTGMTIASPNRLAGQEMRSRDNSLFVDAKGHPWYHAANLGLLTFDPRTRESKLFRPASIGFPSEARLLEDRSGCIWVASPGNDLMRIERHVARFQSFRPLTDVRRFSQITRNNVRDFLPWNANTCLVASLSGLYFFDINSGSERRVPFLPAALSELHTFPIWSLERDKAGRLWIGTGGQGLIILDPGTGRHFRLSSIGPSDGRLSDRSVRCIELVDGMGAWVGTWSGLNYIDARALDFNDSSSISVRQYSADRKDPGSLSNDLVFDIFRDRKGLIWIGTEEGLNVHDQKRKIFRKYLPDNRQKNGPSSGNIRCIMEGRDGNMWIGTHGGGLNRLDRKTGTFTTIDASDGLPSNIVYSILEDDAGMLWLGTHHGLCRYDPATGGIRKYGRRDGLLAWEFNTSAAQRMSDGRLLFGGPDGINHFSPQDIRDRLPVPYVAITDLFIRNSSYPLDGGDIVLRHDENFLSFEFSALSNFASEDNRYRVRLEGVDEDWVESGGRRFAAYTDLNAGRYVFHVMACNSEGVWSTVGASLAFEILPPWWGGRVAIAVYIIAFALLVIAADRVQRHRIMTRERLRASIRETELRVQTADAQNRALLAENRRRQLELEQSEEIRRAYDDLATAHEDLKVAQHQLSTVISGAPIVLFALDQNGMFTLSDGAGLKLLGDAPGEMVGRSVFEIYRDHPAIIDSMRRALEGEEFTTIHTVGGITFETRTSALRGQNGEPAGMIGVAIDITDKVQTQHELEKLSSAVEQSPASVIITNTEGTVEYVNPTFTTVSGYDPVEIIGQNPRLLKSGEMSNEAYRLLWKTLKSGAQWRGEMHNRRKDGTSYWVSASISPLKNRDGVITHFIGIQEDITERKRTEETLARRTAELETIDRIVQVVNSEFDFVKLVHTLLEQGMRLLPQANKSVAFLLNSESGQYDLIEDIGYDFGERVYSFAREELRARYIGSTRRVENGVYILHHRPDLVGEDKIGDVPRACSMLIMAISLHPGRKSADDGFLVFDNMTDENAFDENDARKLTRFRQHAISALAKARTLQTLQKRNTEILRTQEQLVVQEKLASLGRLTAGIAHEIQNPLNFINNFAEVSIELMQEMQEIGNPEERELILRELQRSVSKVHEHGKRAQGIIASMMMHARSSSGDRTWTDVNYLLEEAAALAEHSARSNRTVCEPKIELQLERDLPLLHVVPQEISRVILNLLENAMDAVCERRDNSWPEPFNGRILVRSLLKGESVEIRILDNGTGIPDAVRARIFDPFFTTKPPGKGTGLGLSISYEIIRQQYRGTLDVESVENTSTEFIISLPLQPRSGAPAT
jgi:PAS domain S-box-containing protein